MRPSLDVVPRPRDRDLTAPELQTFVAELADRPELWIDLVKHDQTQRHYEEIFSNEYVTAWLICWMEDHDTGFHDHDISCGAVSVVSGCVREERLTLDGDEAGQVGPRKPVPGTDMRPLHAGSSGSRVDQGLAGHRDALLEYQPDTPGL